MNKDLRPEDFWPEAENLLDNHYKAKRKRRAILWLITALTIIGASIYFISDRRENTVALPVSGTQNTAVIKNNISEIKTQPQSEITIQSKEKLNDNSQTSNSNLIKIENKNSEKESNVNQDKQAVKNTKRNTATLENKNNKAISRSAVVVGTSLALSTSNNSTQTPQLKDLETNSSSTENLSEKTNTVAADNSPITSLSSPLFSGMNIENVKSHSLVTHNSEIKEPKVSGVAEYRFDVLAGANLMTKEISGYTNPTTEAKRNAGEKDVVTPQLSLEVSRVTDKFSIALGLNYIQYGEKVNYDPTSQTKIAVDNSYWNTYTTNYIDTDTNYVYGYVYYSQQMAQRQDSSFVSQTDSVDHTTTNNNILKSTGTNVISYVEMPISVSYYFGRKKFRYGISAGVSAGMLVYSHGYYLNESGTDVININDNKLFKKVIFNGQVGLDFRYCLSAKTHILFRPQYRMNLNSIFKDDPGPSQKYSSFGVSAGVSFLLK